jgi:hypothetical protein
VITSTVPVGSESGGEEWGRVGVGVLAGAAEVVAMIVNTVIVA